MTTETRPLTREEIEEFSFISAYAFNADRRPQALQEAAAFALAVYPPEWTLGAFVDGKLAAGMRVIPFTMRVDGAPVAMGGVSSVATLPEHRRRGHVAALLRRSLSDMRERGQLIAALYTPHPSLYRRFGWEIAVSGIHFSFEPKDVHTLSEAGDAPCRRLTPDDWHLLNDVYEEHTRARNGPLLRAERWWREAVLDATREPWDVALCESSEKTPTGYVVYRTKRVDVTDFHLPFTVLRVRELVALNGDAYLTLVNFLLSHDVHNRIEWYAPPDEPLLQVLDEPWRVQADVQPSQMLRLLDVPRALEARSYGARAHGRKLVLALRDASAPWNEGTWALEVGEKAMRVAKTSEAPDLTMDVRTLAPLYNGYMKASTAARAGLVEAGRQESLVDADEMFAVNHPPFCMDWF